MRILTLPFVTAILLLLSSPVHADTTPPIIETPALNQLAWLAGHWHGGSEGRVTEEIWLPPAGGLMLGLNRDMGETGQAFFEYLRLEQTAEGVFYRASPGGGDATSFKLVECSGSRAVFENKAHDFPQRITYQLTAPDTLTVTISGAVNGKTESRGWTWTRLSGAVVATGGKTP